MTTLVLAALVATELPTVTVEASRLDRRPEEIPSAVRVFGPAAADAAGASDAVALFATSAPELHVRHLGGGNPALAEVSLRGWGESGFGRTLVLVDGERLNAPELNAPNLARLALDGIDRIEVLAGPQSVLHGDGASAGVVNVVTEPQDDTPRSYVRARAGSDATFGLAAGTRGGLAEEGVRYWADGSWDRSDGYRHNSAYQLWNLTGGIRKTWENGSFLRVSSFWNDAEYETPGPLPRAEAFAHPRRTTTPDDDYRRRTYGLNVTGRLALGDENALKLTGTVSRREMTAHASGGTGDYAWWERNVYDTWSYRTTLEWINSSDVFGLANEFILGVQSTYDRLHGWMHSSYSLDKCDYNRLGADVYAEDTLHLTDTLSLVAGARLARTWSENTRCTPPRRNDNMSAMELALVANPVEDAKLWVKGSRFYRAPFLDEVPYDARTFLPSGLLEPESGWNAEFGAEGRLAEEWTLAADAYGTWTDDEIFYDALKGNNLNASDRTFRRGVDARIAWSREKVAEVALAASWVKATFTGGRYEGKSVPLVPETTVALTGRVWVGGGVELLGGYRYRSYAVSTSDFLNAYDTIPSAGLFHVGCAWEPPGCEGLRLAFTVDNLFDRATCDYSTYGASYWPGAGRTFLFSVRYAF